MTADDWRAVIVQAAALGVPRVQFIGGEPTLHPAFPLLVAEAAGAGLAVEVYTNLTHVKRAWWSLFTQHGVSLATSYYSDRAAEHDAFTGRRGSHSRTLANIREAVRRGIPLRAGIIGDGQRCARARAELEAIGVRQIGVDHVRGVGRGAGSRAPGVDELCGSCGRGVAAILSSGEVTPCVFARWLTAGNVRSAPLARILAGPGFARVVAAIPVRVPGTCERSCNPDLDGDDSRPAEARAEAAPALRCGPNGGCNPACDSDPCAPQQ